MDLAIFLGDLLDHGRVKVPEIAAPDQTEFARARQVIIGFEREYRQDLPDEPPALDASAACWAGMMFYRACQFLAYRDLSAETLEADLSVAPPSGDAASIHYSMDLTFRFLPDLIRMAEAANRRDPLVERLRRWAVDWPLSSVGVSGLPAVDATSIVEHRGLLLLYVDRIIACRDRARLADPRVRRATAEALGHFPSLAGEVAAACKDLDAQDVNA